MDSQSFLIPDNRWTVWKCFTYQEYIDKYFVPGKFQKDVPEKIRFVYLTVERLFAYSYFYYPLTEEIDSKITRIFEMAVRERGRQLHIVFNKKQPIINDYINAFTDRPEIDQELISLMKGMKNLRNLHAHPESYNYYGPIGFEKIYSYINFINRLFAPKEDYSRQIESADSLRHNFDHLYNGVFVLEFEGKRYILNAARPLAIGPFSCTSLWVFMPVLTSFPQRMDDYFQTPPIFKQMTNIKKIKNGLKGIDKSTNSEIKVYKSNKQKDIVESDSFKSQIETSDMTVRMFFEGFVDSTIYFERERFIYNEFWN